MVMSGQVLEICTACLRAFSAPTKISAALSRSVFDIMTAPPPLTATALFLEYAHDDNKANDDRDRREQGPHAEPLFDDAAGTLAIAVEQKSFDKEPRAAGDQRQHDEQRKIVSGKARGDSDELVGDRRKPFDEDHQRAVLRVSRPERLDFIAIAIELDEPVPERVVKHG